MESIVRDLADASVNLVHQERDLRSPGPRRIEAALDRLVGYLMKSDAEQPRQGGNG